jgi:hypothetical protein
MQDILNSTSTSLSNFLNLHLDSSSQLVHTVNSPESNDHYQSHLPYSPSYSDAHLSLAGLVTGTSSIPTSNAADISSYPSFVESLQEVLTSTSSDQHDVDSKSNEIHESNTTDLTSNLKTNDDFSSKSPLPTASPSNTHHNAPTNTEAIAALESQQQLHQQFDQESLQSPSNEPHTAIDDNNDTTNSTSDAAGGSKKRRRRSTILDPDAPATISLDPNDPRPFKCVFGGNCNSDFTCV